MLRCRTRRSTSPTETSPSTSARRSLPATTSRRRSLPRSVATSTSRKAEREGFDEIIVRVGPGKGRKVRFTGVLLGEWLTTSYSRVETFRVYRGRTGKFVLHVERSADSTMVDARGQAGRLARVPRRRQRQLRVNARRVDPRGHRDARGAPRADPAAALRHGRRLGPAAAGRGPRHLILGRAPRSREVRHDGRRVPDRDPRDRAAQVVRQAGRPRRHRPRHRRRDRLRPARAQRCRQDDDGPDPVDADRAPTAARSQVAGHDVAREPDAVRAVIGVTGQFSAVDGLFTGEENLQLMADLRHLGKARAADGSTSCSSSSISSTPPRSRSRPTRAACGGGSTWR